MRGALVAAALLAALLPRPACSQVPDTARAPEAEAPALPDRAVQDTVAQDTLPPEPVYDPPRWAISVEVGSLGLDPLQQQPVRADRIDGLGEVLTTAVLTRTVAGKGGVQAGVSGLYNLGRSWAVRGSLSAGRVSVTPRYSGTQDLFVDAAARVTAGSDVAGWLLSAGAGLRVRIPSTTRLQPYVELGAGVQQWTFDESPAFPDLSAHRGWSGYGAAGVIVPIRGAWRAEIRGTQRLFRTPVPAAASEATVGPSSSMTLRLTAQSPETDAYGFADTARELVSELRMDVGLSFGFGTLPDRPETAEPPSPPAS